MKTLKFITLGIMLLLTTTIQAQVKVPDIVNSPPGWGPVGNPQVRYYYLPDVLAFYDVNSSMFIYSDGKTWKREAALPARFKNYDLYSGYKVIMKSYQGNTPYTHFSEFKRRYVKGYNGEVQKTICMKPGSNTSFDKKYTEVRLGNNGSSLVRDIRKKVDISEIEKRIAILR